MKIDPNEQRTPGWYWARIGIPTASNFHKIVTGAGAASSSAPEYRGRLVAEKILGRSLDTTVRTPWMRHGLFWEDKAAEEFKRLTNMEVETVGLMMEDGLRYGCSLDRIVKGESGDEGLEIKCPSPMTHFRYMADGPGNDYKQQVQGQLLVTGYERIWFFSYFPGLPSVKVETMRDEGFIAKTEILLDKFCDSLDEDYKEALLKGPYDIEKALAILSTIMPEEE